jgi:RHS repeat-associated protein
MPSSDTSPTVRSGQAPELSLPNGGGAIRGMGEKFASNPVSGTGSMSVPIASSPGRGGFGPQLTINYDSGAANGAFGFGWNLAAPSVTRKTDKGLPLYRDEEESDIFILSGAEDLTPALHLIDGSWSRDVANRRVHGKEYEIHRYRPRVEGLFARIECWVNLSDRQECFWRSISRDNLTTWFGRTADSRIADPVDRSRIFSWLICETHDDRGNVMVYQYKPEDSAGIDLSQAHERNRTPETRSAQRYVKRIVYGNRTPYFPDLTAHEPVAHPKDWCFELVFDYGEHDLANPLPQDNSMPWRCRHDPFSTYRACFEVRTYRLCRRALMFHHFPEQLGIGVNCLVRSTELEHASVDHHDATQPFYSYLLSVTQRGYVRKLDGGYLSSSLPPVEFEYSRAEIDETVREAGADSLENLPVGLDGTAYRWVDLNGEGVAGILGAQGGSWYYKPNLSPANLQCVAEAGLTRPRFGAVQLVAHQPVLASMGGGARLMDLSGDGLLDIVDYESSNPGYHERTEHDDWQPFRAFRSLPVLDWHNRNMTWVDLTGDGFPDLLISEDTAFWWYESLAVDGFGAGRRVPRALDEEKGPQLIFADGTESIFLADMSGDGLNDLVRVRSGEVCYWPNLGYGAFGTKVTMDGAPYFEESDLFDGRRIHFADIDGSGTADMVYMARGVIDVYFNRSGNGWGSPRRVTHFPMVDGASPATVIDLLGNGTACLVWSSSLPANSRRPLRYIDLMGGQKPHLLLRVRNNLGAETVVHYAPSTRFYVADKLAGTPWLTRLPFPVHVVERVESYDYINRNRFVTRYAYHHGYFDGVEREFRGFGRVDQWDTEEMAAVTPRAHFPEATNLDPALSVPPVLTKTWYHTGAYFGEQRVSRHFEQEYYAESYGGESLVGLTAEQLKSMLLEDTVLPREVLLPDGARLPREFSAEELREACRALRGSILRQEIYALDGTERAERPYSASERNYTIEVLQPQGRNRYGVFVSHARESIDFHYERVLYPIKDDIAAIANAADTNSRSAADPRVTHAVTLAVDYFNNPLQEVNIAYGRRYSDPTLAPSDQVRQSTLLATYVENDYSNLIFTDDEYRIPVSVEARTHELLQLRPEVQHPGVTNLVRFAELKNKLARAADGTHDVPSENLCPTGLKKNELYRRLIKQSRIYYRPDDFGASREDPDALLPLGRLESLGLAGVSYQLAFIPDLIERVYQDEGTRLLPDPAEVFGRGGGGYVDVDGDGRWWSPSGRSYFAPARVSASSEKAEALRHFFVARRFEDPFGNATTIDYDAPYDLLPSRSTDAAGNVFTSLNDYRVLSSVQLTDPNENRRSVSLDALGLVAGTAVMGKSTEQLGDSLEGFDADLAQSQIDAFVAAADPHHLAAALLVKATTRIVYDVHRFYRSRRAAPDDPSQWLPVFAASLLRETHVSDLAPHEISAIQISFGYSDGFGREIQKKMPCAPGPLTEEGSDVNPRWIGTGWVINNNKGKPVREYEPFFSASHAFEFGVTVGVSPVLFYDPLERVVATIYPNHTYDKVIMDPWRRNTYDVNDTAAPHGLETGDPRTDLDVRGLTADYFKAMGAAEADWKTWYVQRISGALGARERDAARKTKAHADTPSTGYVDPLGRAFLNILRNRVICADRPLDGAEERVDTRLELDIEGRQLVTRDALKPPENPLGRIIARYAYDLMGGQIYRDSSDSGERWTLADVLGKPLLAFDGLGRRMRNAYDGLRRPVGLYVCQRSQQEQLAERTIYGEAIDDARERNLRGKAVQVFDAAGIVVNTRFDFKGNLLSDSRQLVKGVGDEEPDWQRAPELEDERYHSHMAYDALNRGRAATLPDGSLLRRAYDRAGLLKHIDLRHRGGGAEQIIVENIEYNAKAQRERIHYGNGAATEYRYDPLTFRLAQLRTTRRKDDECLQDLAYSFDPIGNITSREDRAEDKVFFRNQCVDASSEYQYDALYRLIVATGRESALVSEEMAHGGCNVPPLHSPSASDDQALRRYVDHFKYDAVGNLQELLHTADRCRWRRVHEYGSIATNNHLTGSRIGSLHETFTYDGHGNTLAMTHLPELVWDFKDQLQRTRHQRVAEGTGGLTRYVYDGGGRRVRKIVLAESGEVLLERIYLKQYEVERKPRAEGTILRNTIHVMDSGTRVALIESREDIRTTRFQLADQLGSVCVEVDSRAEVLTREEYYSFGETSFRREPRLPGLGRKRYRFAGQERDIETALAYHGARYYAPWLARWISCDPEEFKDGANLYVYCRCNPINRTDSKGSDSKWCVLCNPFSDDVSFSPWQFTKKEIAPRGLGALKAVGGGVETVVGGGMFAGGVATSEIGIGIPVAVGGGIIALHGLDTFQAGLRQIWTGDDTDTFTSEGLQAAGVSRGKANLVDAGIGVVFTFGGSAVMKVPSVAAATGPKVASGLVHLTTDTAEVAIGTSKTLGKGACTIYAGPAALADASGAGVTLRTGLLPSQANAAILLPDAAAAAFRTPAVLGPFTAWQRLMGTAFTEGAGSINLATGAFTRTGPATNQLVIYGIDTLFTTGRLAEPGAAAAGDPGSPSDIHANAGTSSVGASSLIDPGVSSSSSSEGPLMSGLVRPDEAAAQACFVAGRR